MARIITELLLKTFKNKACHLGPILIKLRISYVKYLYYLVIVIGNNLYIFWLTVKVRLVSFVSN